MSDLDRFIQGYKQQLIQTKERIADRLIAQAKERKAKQDATV